MYLPSECTYFPTLVVASAKIEVDGKPIRKDPIKLMYFAVNKPKGYSCVTNRPEDGSWGDQRPVMDLFKDWSATWERQHPGQVLPRLQVAGNLDVNATGLMFVTNDGRFSAKARQSSRCPVGSPWPAVTSWATRPFCHAWLSLPMTLC